MLKPQVPSAARDPPQTGEGAPAASHRWAGPACVGPVLSAPGWQMQLRFVQALFPHAWGQGQPTPSPSLHGS